MFKFLIPLGEPAKSADVGQAVKPEILEKESLKRCSVEANLAARNGLKMKDPEILSLGGKNKETNGTITLAMRTKIGPDQGLENFPSCADLPLHCEDDVKPLPWHCILLLIHPPTPSSHKESPS